ncbi:MAG: methionyl-tRNA formyltransferase, partial [Bacteroidales bacterium]|nr:methionyl-tRNA formyltransferase [Bacteroidales bacterium]
VVTLPDKPMGRGLKLTHSEVKKVAEKYHLPLLQPEKLRDEEFLTQLKRWGADLFLVIAFRMLPEAVWKLPAKGTVNLHASLLPRYRGAAPINRVIMNGEKETGVTTFFINEKIDEGNLILSRSHAIAPDENAGELHDALLSLGIPLVAESLDLIEKGGFVPCKQEMRPDLPTAPKIFRSDCRMDWRQSVHKLFNQVRGLSPYPGAFTMVRKTEGEEPLLLKIFKAKVVGNPDELPCGRIATDNRHNLLIAASDGCLQVEELQLFGKRRMEVGEFLAGNKMFDGLNCEF